MIMVRNMGEMKFVLVVVVVDEGVEHDKMSIVNAEEKSVAKICQINEKSVTGLEAERRQGDRKKSACETPSFFASLYFYVYRYILCFDSSE